ncbi:OadG family protein [Glaciecola petra]|uniref:Probable oxaloacetate decarboxylase gamma chain n=1 Tax=Glaciecola petra TaxID=3075602 RepID=A0ABU2ZP65_9ALTE|nr:OadG family protein [Aestuariibacter sp. P117]MDT0593843.1 OadG family protein [Aestuariibacter sp. P117]
MTEQLLEAGVLLAVGMCVVFAFLTMLIGGIHSIAWFASKFPDESLATNAHKTTYKNNNTNQTPTTVDPIIAAAITGAIHAHRSHKN